MSRCKSVFDQLHFTFTGEQFCHLKVILKLWLQKHITNTSVCHLTFANWSSIHVWKELLLSRTEWVDDASPLFSSPRSPLQDPPLLLLWLQARFFSRKDLTIRNMQVRAKFNTSAQNKPEIFTMWYYSLIKLHAETAGETRSSRFCMSDAGWGRLLSFHVGFDSFRHQWKSAVNTTEAITSSGLSCQWAALYPQEKQRSTTRGRNILRKSVGTSMWLKTDTSWYRTTKGFTERGVQFDVPEFFYFVAETLFINASDRFQFLLIVQDVFAWLSKKTFKIRATCKV